MYNAGVLEHIGRNGTAKQRFAVCRRVFQCSGGDCERFPGQTWWYLRAWAAGRKAGLTLNSSPKTGQKMKTEPAQTGCTPGRPASMTNDLSVRAGAPGDRMSSTMRKSLVHDLGVTVQRT